MKPSFITLLFTIFFALVSQGQNKDSIKLYLHGVIAILRENSLYSDRVKWRLVNDSLDIYVQKSSNYKDADKVIINIFSRLRDPHGFISTKDTFYRYKEFREDRLSEGIKVEYQKPRSVRICMLPDAIGYYKMPSVIIGSNTQKMKEWSNKLRDSLCLLLSYHPEGLILDLRMNNGGNSLPMFQAFKILLSESYKIYYVDKNLTWNNSETVTDSSSNAYQKSAVPDRTCHANRKIPIAVLIGPATASSGEILAFAFSSRKQTKLFGEQTVGLCNSTNGFKTNINSFNALLTVSYIADHRKKINKSQIMQPDVYVKSNDNYSNIIGDTTVQVALAWLKKKL